MAPRKKAETAEEKKPAVPEKAEENDTAAEIEKIRAQYEKQIADMAEMQKAMQEQMLRMREQMEMVQKPQVVQVQADVEQVHFLWNCECADDNVQDFGVNGQYGRVVGKHGEFFVPKNELSRVLDGMTRMCLDKRWLIVVDGLSEQEREAIGVNYRDGELLDKMMFLRLVELEDGILPIFPKLCEGHKEMVAKRYYEAYKNGNKHVIRSVVVELNRLCKEAGMKDNAFSAIIQEMNESET